ncbi:Hypothetical predicted protein [Mytilus galloprovincialis]|uniref:EGF-like domain-containing protein n=1 Tax=Mytilus galloprovincialis TaxID=29158 RepID=A0A8B6HMU9_MYTGA|nr:Hypothetical predicted protein [Mytilus galloprovincialis]VDI81235.1 Hypothetical predicted protein [Mytilus galloprovincialis]
MPTPVYCVSFDDGSPQSCDYFKDIDLCSVHKNGVDKTQDLLTEEQDRNAEQQAEQQTVRRRKRDTTTPNAFTYDSTFNAPTVVTWPTNSGITLQQAKEHCEEAVKPTERAACVAIVGNTAPDVQSCINDVGLTDSKIWVDAVIQSIQEQCYTTVTTDENQWVDNSSGIPSINSTIDDNICLNDCSSAGTCLQGECNCNANRFGPDCSVKSTDKPIVLASYSNNVCDLSKLNCTLIQVYGARFINSTDLTCHLTEVTVGTNGITNTLATEKVKAIYKSLAHVVCPNPDRKTVTVALSNDGNTPSDQQSIYVAYTSNCYTCTEDAATATATCTTNLASSCLIGSECYVKDTKSPTDQCMACRPSIATDSWSKVTGSGCEDKPPNEDGSEMNAVTIIAVSVTIAGLILIGIIVAGICVYRRTRLRKEKLESAGNSEIEYRSKNPNAMVPYFPPGSGMELCLRPSYKL